LAEAAPAASSPPIVGEATVRRISERLGEGEELLDLRKKALAAFEETSLPSRVRHLWRFTDPVRLLPAEITAQAKPGLAEAIPSLTGDNAGAVLDAWSGTLDIHVPEAAKAQGIRILPTAEASMAGLPGSVIPASSGYFEALNLAAFTAGVVVDIPSGVELEAPVRIHVPAGSGAYLPRILIRVGKGSKATVVEEHLGGGPESRMVSVTEILAEPGAHVTHVVFQHWNADVRGHLTGRSRVGRDAKVTLVVVSTGGGLTKMNLGAILDERGAQSEIGGVVLGAGRQHMDHHTLHDHRAGNTCSNIDFKVALTGRARSAYTGLIRIEKEAAGAEAYQENRNLLLSEGCRADTIPELEILTDDVQCTHGATVAPMDNEQVFYLESRGIPPKEARRLIVQGFLEAALGRLPGALRDQMESVLSSNLEEFLDGEEQG